MTDQLIEAIVPAVMILGLVILAVRCILRGPTVKRKARKKGGKRWR